MNREPIVIIGTIGAVVVAALEALVQSGALTGELGDPIVRIVQAVVVIATILLGRSKVTPV